MSESEKVGGAMDGEMEREGEADILLEREKSSGGATEEPLTTTVSLETTQPSTSRPHSTEAHPELIPISLIASNHYIFSPTHAIQVRTLYHIPGTLIGTLPQSPQQNVFTGLPLLLMPEEARLLVEKGVAYIVDEVAAHRDGFGRIGKRGRREWRERLREDGMEVARGIAREKEAEKVRALKRVRERRGQKRSDGDGPGGEVEDESSQRAGVGLHDENGAHDGNEESHLFDTNGTAAGSAPTKNTDDKLTPYIVTPTLSPSHLYPPRTTTDSQFLPATPHSYPFYRHIHNLTTSPVTTTTTSPSSKTASTPPLGSYYLTPGLRFGSQYMIYPGDPLRFHSHFLGCSFGWRERVELLTLVGGGRLGTGVKKGFVVGGVVEKTAAEKGEKKALQGKKDADSSRTGDGREGLHEMGGDTSDAKAPDVRCFTIEWSSM